MLAVSPAWDVGCGLWCACALGTVQIMHNPGTIRDAQVAWPSGAVGYSYHLCGHCATAVFCSHLAKMTPPSGGAVGVQEPVVKVSRVSPICRGMSPTCRGRVAVRSRSVAPPSRAGRRARRAAVAVCRGVSRVSRAIFSVKTATMYLDSHRRGRKMCRPAIRGNQHSAQLRQASLADEEVLWPVDVDFNLVKNTCAGVVLVVHAGL